MTAKNSLRRNSVSTVVALCFVIHFACVCASSKQTGSMEADVAILNKYMEMDQQLKRLVNSGIKQFLPYFMEANEHLSLSPKCTQNLFALISGLNNLKLWALSFVDASGKLQDGLLWGNLQVLGNYDQCLNITVLKKDGQTGFRGKHCTVELKPLRLQKKDPNEPRLNFVEATRNASELVRNWVEKEHELVLYTPRIGMCVPSGCGVADVQQMVDYFSRMSNINATVATCQVEKSFPQVTTRTIVIMCIFVFLIAVGIVASGIEYYLKIRSSSEESRWPKLLLCFSITSNFQKVMDTNSTDDNKLACLHGIRALTMFYIIIVHRCAIPVLLSMTGQMAMLEDWKNRFFSQIIINASITVDTFLLMGGLLNSYLRRKKETKTTKSQPVKFLIMVFFRMWRLYPALICAILLNYLFVPQGPIAPLIDVLVWRPCNDYWWRNFLFIHNFYRVEDMCLRHTWYLSVEIQLFILSFIPVTLLLRNRRIGHLISGIFIVCGIITTMIQVWVLKAPANASQVLTDMSKEQLRKFDIVHFSTFVHTAPYFIGVLLGDFLYAREKIKIPVVYQIVGWLAASSIYISTMFSTLALETGPLNTQMQLNNSFYMALRPLAALGVAWMVICCAYGYGGIINYILTLKVWVPISRLTYFMYLVHIILQVFYVLNQRTQTHYHEMTLIWEYAGDVALTGLLSLALTVLVESPNIALMKMAFEGLSKGKEKPPEMAAAKMENGFTKEGGSASYELKQNSLKEVSSFKPSYRKKEHDSTQNEGH